ncbi:MAG: hypothetical protein H7Z13_16495 [Ferruginibacter sp.]|nr:hypothetical protein [Ferruginibacter sp.]
MHTKAFILYILLVCSACYNNTTCPANSINMNIIARSDTLNETNPYQHIRQIPLPAGFARITNAPGSFAHWLLNVPLKKDKTVYLFDGIPKASQAGRFAVLNISVGDKDLQQCADAVMRLRAEYLFASGKYPDIRFRDNAGRVYHFDVPYTYQHLLHYLQQVFGMCGSASLAKQLNRISYNAIAPGDVIIRGGFPGHAVIVMDVAINKDGKKIYLLAQSYMPAQDIHVLVNPMNKILSPWYEVNEDEIIHTPEYDFRKDELKRW